MKSRDVGLALCWFAAAAAVCGLWPSALSAAMLAAGSALYFAK